MTTRLHPERVARESADLRAERLARLRELVPEAFSEGRLDPERLRRALGEDAVDERPERYHFTWAGRRDAIRALQTPSRATLLPDRAASLDWDATGHAVVEGDNLEALKLLFRPYFGRVKLIYIDPPYNTGNDFVYPDDFAQPLQNYLALTGQADAAGNRLTSNPETGGRYHSAWLSMMYPRLFLARQLLREDGVIFVSIDDHEVHNLRLLMNEIFGEENFVAQVIWEKKYAKQNDATWFSTSHDYILLYARNKSTWRPRRLERAAAQLAGYRNPDNDPRGPWQSVVYTCNKTRAERPNLYYPIKHPCTGEAVLPSETRVWGYDLSTHQRHVEENRLWWGSNGEKDKPRLKVFLDEVGTSVVPDTIWHRADVADTQEGKRAILSLFKAVVFDTPKPARLIGRMLQIATDPQGNDLVLDFFAGSGTTAQAVLEQNRADGGNRRFLLVQMPEPTGRTDYPTIAAIARERIRRVSARLRETAAQAELALAERAAPEDLGFRAFRLAPSHFRPWQPPADADVEAYAAQLEAFADPLLPGWSAEDVIHEVALREGYGLGLRTEPVAGLQGVTVHRVHDPDRGQHFLISLDEQLRLEALRPLALGPDDLFVCRDAALDDETAANLALQCRLKTL